MRVALWSREVGTMRSPAKNASATIGMLTRNTEFQEKRSSSKPLAIGPNAPPAPAIAVQMAIARGRSDDGKMLTMIDNVAGMMNAAPSPITPRLAMTAVEL